MEERGGLPVLLFENPTDWEQWLAANPQADGAWLKFAKKGSGVSSINYDQALEAALCYGWIDGLVNKYDDKFYLTRYTPRRAKSVWSARNRELVEELIKNGKMTSAGLAHIDAAKADGRWDKAYASSTNAVMPDDFLCELAKNKAAAEFYKTLNKANLYAIYFRLHTAVKPETRQKHIEKIIAQLATQKPLR